MTTEDTVFKFKNRYILLEDLESWYSHGFVTPDDYIQIIENGEHLNYRIGDLIETYGSQLPFRRIPVHLNDLHNYTRSRLLELRTSHPVKVEYDWDPYWRSRLIRTKNKSDEQIEKERFVFVDYPLFNLDQGLGETRMNMQDVLEYYGRLKRATPIKNWCKTYETYFSFLNKKPINKTQEAVAICRICNFTPYSASLFFEHMFHSGHVAKIAKYGVSKKCFQFWENHFDQCIRKFGERPGHPIGNYFLEEDTTKMPLSYSENSLKSKKLKRRDIWRLVDLFAKVDPERLRSEDGFLKVFYDTSYCPKQCEECKVEMPKDVYKLTEHILSEQHLTSIRQVNMEEFYFWINYLSINISAKHLTNSEISRVMNAKPAPKMPLFNFVLGSCVFEVEDRGPKIAELKTAFDSLKNENWTKNMRVIITTTDFVLQKSPERIACVGCDLPENSFRTPEEVVLHLFSEKHVSFLLLFGFTEKAYLWWQQKFADLGAVYAFQKSKNLNDGEVMEALSVKKAPNTCYEAIPLFNSNTGIHKRTLESIEIDELVNSFDQIDPERLRSKDGYLNQLYNSGQFSWKVCEVCNMEMPVCPYEFTKHILSVKHLASLECISEWELNFWTNYLNIEIMAKELATSEICRILMSEQAAHVPLLEFQLISRLVDVSSRRSKMRRLQDLLKKNRRNTDIGNLRSVEDFVPEKVFCSACCLPKDSFKSRVELVEHLFSEQHVDYLVKFGFTNNSYRWWKVRFQERAGIQL